ncbi:TetR/AcrR family transcriptional regulator [Beijerinckia sp. L45]|uniref:TetR/AcrR family transcriptional regulator n=1 Tax=Beijerinckia sp. L45 TaxID=1641855 RepID=UPI00131A7762|nr:TetR/AcrR family transcriptional regulator [Beijerinckia sp. L45]
MVAKASKSRTGDEAAAPRRPRIAAADRERMILSEAIRFFAEEGFDGQLRVLAARLGITHSVLFRHFPSKDALIARVYQDVYVRRMRPEWAASLCDRSTPLDDRLGAFYRDYTDAIFHRDWIRLFMFAGLKGVDINAPYLALLRDTVLLPICIEYRVASNDRGSLDRPLSDREIERALGLHGRIFYLAIRKFVYGLTIPENLGGTIGDAVAAFLSVQPDAPPEATPRLTSATLGAAEAGPRRRMPPHERERFIVDEAVRFFAEHGMAGQMRELARRLGVTHPLLYRYFPTKAALIERVYEEVYLDRWNADWEASLRDPSRPLSERLTTFYIQYSKAIDRYEWIRIFVFAGLHQVDICARYLDLVRRQIIEPVADALRAQRLLRSSADDRALEIAWGLHGQIVYIAIRRWIYGLEPQGSLDRIIEDAVAGVIGMAPCHTGTAKSSTPI